jgi:cellulose synthase/poly-beta-1,6-N-acetylglucosamine synthase-like glycosyltransferase
MEFLPHFEDPFEFYANLVFWTLGFIQLFWLLFFYLRLAVHKETAKGYTPEVTIIIAARNEEDNLFELLPSILTQDYPEYEVIVVNHQSVDDSLHILKALQREHSHLKIIELERNKHLAHGKKLPLTVAIKGAKYEHLLFTDADCKPISDKWIRSMAGHFTHKKNLILGYAPYFKEKGFTNWFIRLDTAMIGMNYLSFAKAGVPYMGVGRNMGYTRSLFESVSGFKSHYSLQSGDDDLFVQEATKKRNYDICIAPDSFCYSEAKSSWKEWVKQKSRHYTTSTRYPLIKKLLLGIYPLTLILLYVSFIILLLNFSLNWLNIGIIGIVLLIKWIIFGVIFKRLKERKFIFGALVWDLLYAIIIPVQYYTTEKSTQSKWK